MARMESTARRSVLLVQLPIPPLGPAPIRGNVPLAAAYLKLFVESRGLGSYYDIELYPPAQANTLGDRALVEALAAHQPWLVGFTCYLWNIERTLWVARAEAAAAGGARRPGRAGDHGRQRLGAGQRRL
jgi:hypothetical protein